jgi:ComF family protein
MTSLEPAADVPRPWRDVVLDALLPPRCLGCTAAVDVPGRLCAACWAGVDFIVPPHCDCCGLPFAFDEGEGAICGACVRDQPAFARARAVLRYNGVARSLVLGFKHGDRTHAAPAFAAWMARSGEALLDDAEVVTPVPLHRFRLFTRRYNQSGLLAREIALAAGLDYAPDALRRTRPTPSQGGLTRRARFLNVRGAFKLRGGRDVAGRRVLLVDDVMTTGATADACAKALVRAGAAAVDVLTLARVVPEGD